MSGGLCPVNFTYTEYSFSAFRVCKATSQKSCEGLYLGRYCLNCGKMFSRPTGEIVSGGLYRVRVRYRTLLVVVVTRRSLNPFSPTLFLIVAK